MTLTADVKALLDPVSPLTQVYRAGWVPDDAAFPYATILDPISMAVAMSGDGRTLGRRELLQVDLWQNQADEDDSLVGDMIAALDGVSLGGLGRVKVQDVVKVDPDEDEVVHHAFTLSVPRS